MLTKIKFRFFTDGIFSGETILKRKIKKDAAGEYVKYNDDVNRVNIRYENEEVIAEVRTITIQLSNAASILSNLPKPW